MLKYTYNTTRKGRGENGKPFLDRLRRAAVALLFALMQRNRVMAFSEGNEKMRKIAASIRAGANAYLKHQYTRCSRCFWWCSSCCW